MATEAKKYSLRPQAKPVGDSTMDGAFRVFMSPGDMNMEGLTQGDYISITSEAGVSGVAIVWRATDNIGGGHKSQGNPVIRISEWLRGSWGFELKEKYLVARWSGFLPHISSITLTNVSVNDHGGGPPVDVKLLEFWAQFTLASTEGIAAGGTIEVLPRTGLKKRKRQRFLIEKIEPPLPDNSVLLPYVFDHESKIVFRDIDAVQEGINGDKDGIKFDFDSLKGIDQQLASLQNLIRQGLGLDRNKTSAPFNAYTEPILVQGVSGTGKSVIIDALASTKGLKAIRLTDAVVSPLSSKTSANLDKIFEEAKVNQPSLILIDNIASFTGKSDAFNFAATLGSHISRAAVHHIQVVATARNILDIHDQVVWRFKDIIDFPVPTKDSRIAILRHFCGTQCEDSVIEWVAERTHAFVAHDLRYLHTRASRTARRRIANRTSASSARSDTTYVSSEIISKFDSAADLLPISMHDFEIALRDVHASAMNEVYIEVPRVRWSDIAGSEEVKKQLQQATSISANTARLFRIQPTRGMLLYGPPGCSKTLLAKAFATESGLNFLAVKGPELISKFVGDTEHNIREIFRKARAAAPSVIFFDEFDAMARRDTGHDSLSPVTALLTEMDGVEVVSDVFVLAATNRPQVIDKALIRPGRIDKVLYVGPPDLKAREEIFRINTRGRPIDSSVNVTALASQTEGFSGADVAELCRSATNDAAADYEAGSGKLAVSASHFETALRKHKSVLSAGMLAELQAWEGH